MDEIKKTLQKNLKQKHFMFYLSQRSKSTSSLTDSQKFPEFTVNHIWNAVYIKGEWYFVDAFFCFWWIY